MKITGAQGSGILKSMSLADCVVVLHAEQGSVNAGDEVDVVALWATAHGIADLSAGLKLRTLQGKSPQDREAMIRAVLLRCLPGAA